MSPFCPAPCLPTSRLQAVVHPPYFYFYFTFYFTQWEVLLDEFCVTTKLRRVSSFTSSLVIRRPIAWGSEGGLDWFFFFLMSHPNTKRGRNSLQMLYMRESGRIRNRKRKFVRWKRDINVSAERSNIWTGLFIVSLFIQSPHVTAHSDWVITQHRFHCLKEMDPPQDVRTHLTRLSVGLNLTVTQWLSPLNNSVLCIIYSFFCVDLHFLPVFWWMCSQSFNCIY